MAGSGRSFAVRDFRRPDLERLGFVGFVPVRELLGTRPVAAAVPKEPGVYIAYRDSEWPVSFVRQSPAGQWRGDLSLSLAALRSRWVPESPVIYIGVASRPRPHSTNGLRRRVSAFLRFGAGRNAPHAGGYPTWQLRDADRLLIAWWVIKPPRSPRVAEHNLRRAHIERFEALPFANSAQ